VAKGKSSVTQIMIFVKKKCQRFQQFAQKNSRILKIFYSNLWPEPKFGPLRMSPVWLPPSSILRTYNSLLKVCSHQCFFFHIWKLALVAPSAVAMVLEWPLV
jgi:hypothetical protein